MELRGRVELGGEWSRGGILLTMFHIPLSLGGRVHCHSEQRPQYSGAPGKHTGLYSLLHFTSCLPHLQRSSPATSQRGRCGHPPVDAGSPS